MYYIVLFFLWISVLTYSNSDPSLLHFTLAVDINNWMSLPGAIVAGTIFELMGHSGKAWLLIVTMFQFKKENISLKTRVFIFLSSLLVIPWYTSFFFTSFNPNLLLSYSGIFGYTFQYGLTNILYSIGAMLFLGLALYHSTRTISINKSIYLYCFDFFLSLKETFFRLCSLLTGQKEPKNYLEKEGEILITVPEITKKNEKNSSNLT